MQTPSGARHLIFGSDPSPTSILYVCEQWRRWWDYAHWLRECAGSPEPLLVVCVIKYHNLMSWLILGYLSYDNNWASSWDYGTYHKGDQQRLRRACASAQSRQSLHCSHTWSIEIDKGSDQNQTSSFTGWLHMHFWRMSLRRTKSAIISWAGSISGIPVLRIFAVYVLL